MVWIRAEPVRFPIHGALFRMSERTAKAVGIQTYFEAVQDSPGNLQTLLESLILRVRPDLTQCQVEAMHFNPSRMAWEVMVTHPNLPEAAWGEGFSVEIIEEPAEEAEHG